MIEESIIKTPISKNKKMICIYIFAMLFWPIIISFLLNILIFKLNNYGIHILSESQGSLIVNILVYGTLIISVYALYKDELKEEWRNVKDKIIKYFFGYGAGFWIVNITVENIAAVLGTATTENQEAIDVIITTDYVVSLLIFGIIGPIVEEIVFRYIIMNHLQRKNRYMGILISSVLFGLLHISRLDFLEFFIYFVSGLYLGIVYEKTKNMIAPMAAHMFNNLIGILISLLLLMTV